MIGIIKQVFRNHRTIFGVERFPMLSNSNTEVSTSFANVIIIIIIIITRTVAAAQGPILLKQNMNITKLQYNIKKLTNHPGAMLPRGNLGGNIMFTSARLKRQFPLLAHSTDSRLGYILKSVCLNCRERVIICAWARRIEYI